MATEPTPSPSELGKALQQVTDLTQRIVHDEIELAKAEVSAKVTKLGKGAAVGVAAGVFVFFAVIMLLNALAWLIWNVFFGDTTSYWLGFLIVAVLLLVLAGVGGYLALKLFKGGAPPTPQMAIDEGKKVKATLTEAGKS